MVMLSEQPLRSSLQVAPLTIQKNKSELADHVYKSENSSHSPYSHSRSEMTPPTTPHGSQEDLGDGSSSTPPVFHNFLRAFYPFHPSYAMTDSAVTLPLNEGDVVLVHSIHTNGWADGTLLVSGARGWLPTNYCSAYDPDEMRNLLKALLNFWDLLRSASVDDNEIFSNQEFMKGIIAGVRYLLVRSDTHYISHQTLVASERWLFCFANILAGADQLSHEGISRGATTRGAAQRQKVTPLRAVVARQDG